MAMIVKEGEHLCALRALCRPGELCHPKMGDSGGEVPRAGDVICGAGCLVPGEHYLS